MTGPQLASEEMARLIRDSRPASPQLHRFSVSGRGYVLVADGTRLFEIDDTFPHFIGTDAQADAGIVIDLLEQGGFELGSAGLQSVPDAPPVRALSLAIAQKCNLGCHYCYAGQGQFGGAARNMELDVAVHSVELLISQASAGDRVNLAFMGGEPLLNRTVLQKTVEYADQAAAARGIVLTFSITTNGTLVDARDGEFFERYGFAVTVSLDGLQTEHDELRPFRSGAGSFDRIVRNIEPLLNRQKRMQVSARVTVTPHHGDLRRTLDEFIAMGFHSVGFSPLLHALDGRNEMSDGAVRGMLAQMVECGSEFERRLIAGERYPFANAVNALREIHKGTHRPYPCGAGAGYFGVSAAGELAACHRFVGDGNGSMGSVRQGVDRALQARWLAERHVDRQQPCQSCWARYMCGGGCHHETIARGRPACDYIRGWLQYCLEAYTRLIREVPSWFGVDRNLGPYDVD